MGFQIKRYPSEDVKNRMTAISYHNITHILDVGANSGQYAMGLREFGYLGKISSFEPQKTAFEQLKSKSTNDKDWDIYPFGLGQKDEVVTINVTQNSFSSSILPMTELHSSNAEKTDIIYTEEIQIKKLDTLTPQLVTPFEKTLLKIDTQGFEKDVLLGALESLPKFTLLQVEMSLFHLYAGETLFYDMIHFLHQHDFRLYALEGDNLSNKKTGQLLQIDGIFINTQLAPEFG